jgi:large repetitive protein
MQNSFRNLTMSMKLRAILVTILFTLDSINAFGQSPCSVSNWGPLLVDDCNINLNANGGLAPNSPAIFCEGEVVTVYNNSSPSAEVQTTYVSWGDGTCEMSNGFKTSMDHIYDFPNDTCIQAADGTIYFEIQLGVEKKCTGNKRSFSSVKFGVKVRFKPVALFAASPPIVCLTDKISFTNSSCENTNSPTYLWNMGNGVTFTTENVPNYVYQNIGGYNVSMTVSNQCGSNTMTLPVLVTAPATASATPSATQICSGQTVTFSNTSTNAIAHTWTVTPNTGVMFVPPSTNTSASPVIRFNTPGTYTVRLKPTGCGNPVWETVITVLSGATITMSPLPDLCDGGSNSIAPSPSIGGTGTTVAWIFTGGTPGSSTSNIPGTITYPGPGSYIITGVATNGCNSVTLRDTFQINPPATASVTTTATEICSGQTITFNNSSTNASGHTWTVTPNTGIVFVAPSTSASTSPTIRFNNTGNYTVRLKVTGCGSPIWETQITVLSGTTFVMPSLPDLCDGTNNSISPMPAIGGSGTNVSWTFAGGNPATSSSSSPGTITYPGPGKYVVTAVADGLCNTVNFSDTFDIVSPAIANALISDDTLCGPGEVLMLTNASINAFSTNPFTWSVSPSTGVTYSNGTNPGSANPQIVFNQAGNYQITLKVNGCGMPSWDTTVLVILTPTATISQIPDGCIDFSINPLQYVSLDNTTNANIYWTFGGGSPASATSANPGLVQFSGYGIHFLAVNITSECGSVSLIDSFAIIQADSVTVMAAGPFCNTDSIVQLVANQTQGTWTGTGVNASGLFNPAIAPLNLASPIIFSTGSGSCLVTDTVLVLVQGTPVNAGADKSLCLNAPAFTLNGFSPTGGVFSGSLITSAGYFDPMLAGSGAHTIVYTFTDVMTGCVNEDQLDINVLGVPTANLDSISNTCIGAPIDFGSFAGSSTAGNSCTWDFGDNTTSINCNAVHSYSVPGVYQVTLIATNQIGCRDTAVTAIEVITAPDANFVTDKTMGCADLDVQITNLSTINSYTQYIWNFGFGLPDTIVHPGTVTLTQGEYDTTYIFELIATNKCAELRHTVPITVYPWPQVRFGTDVNTGCSPLEVNFNNVSVGNPDYYQWFVNGVLIDTAFQLSQQVFLTNDHDSIYTIMLIAGNECGLDTVIHTVSVRPNPVKAFLNVSNNIGCAPFTVKCIDYSTQGLFVSWDLGDGTLATGDTVEHTFTIAGDYTIRLFVNNGCGFDTNQVTITVLPQPLVSFVSAPYVCFGDTASFTSTAQGIAGTIWDFGDGTIDSTLTQVHHQYAASGTYIVSMTGFAVTTGCPATVTNTILVRDLPVPQISLNDTSGCEPHTIKPINNTAGNNTYLWSFGDGTTGIGPNGQHIYPQAGSYQLRVSITDFYGCKQNWMQVPIQVYPKPSANYTTQQDQLCVTPTTLIFTNQSQGADAFLWSFGSLGTSTQVNPSLTISQPITIPAQLIAVSQFQCKDTMGHDVRVYTAPMAEANLVNNQGCAPFTVQFQNTSIGVNQYHWVFSDGSTSSLAQPTYTFNNPGQYTAILYASADSICFDSVALPTIITVLESPMSAFTYEQVTDTTVTPNGLIRFENQSVGGNAFIWHFGDGDSSLLENPIHRFRMNGTTTVRLIAINTLGCPDTATIDVPIDFFGQLYIPNAITPESGNDFDGLFKGVGVGLQKFSLSVYATNGQRVWHTEALDDAGQPSEAWNGRYQNTGDLLPQGLYWWQAEAIFINGDRWHGMDYGEGPTKQGKVFLMR